MSDLVEFLRARLDEDERVARDSASAPWSADIPGTIHVDPRAIAENRHKWGKLGHVATVDHEAYQQHIARQDPARVLADVEAKRKIMEEHGPHGRYSDECRTCGCPDSCGCAAGVDYPCDTLRILALPYADHPEYDERWRP